MREHHHDALPGGFGVLFPKYGFGMCLEPVMRAYEAAPKCQESLDQGLYLFFTINPCGPKGMHRRGYRAQPRVSTLGPTTPERRALKGRQIESASNAEKGSSCRTSQSAPSFCATMDANSFGTPVAPSGRTVHLWGFPGLKPWDESCSPFGACRRQGISGTGTLINS